MSFEEAAMIEPLACCIRGWNKFKHQKGDTVVVLGRWSHWNYACNAFQPFMNLEKYFV